MRLPPEILKHVKLIEINTRKLVNNLFAGEYRSAFRGQGMAFSEFREYVAGDDVRAISWPVTARTGKPFIKTFDEERELTVILAVDISNSTLFGTATYFKGEIMTHLAALLSFSAVRNKDQIGLLLFSNQVELFVPPRKGRVHVQRILRDLLYHQPKSTATRVSAALEYLQRYLKKRSIVFLFSDFFDANYSNQLRALANKHEVIAVVVRDKLEAELPSLGLVVFEDSESGETKVVDTSTRAFQEYYRREVARQQEQRDNELAKAQVATIAVSCHTDYWQPLVNFFRKRQHK